MLNKQMLKDIFDTAREQKLPFVVVGIEAPTGQEAIVIPAQTYDAKEVFYMSAYDDNLTHVMNSNVRIFNFIAVDSAEGIPFVFDTSAIYRL